MYLPNKNQLLNRLSVHHDEGAREQFLAMMLLCETRPVATFL